MIGKLRKKFIIINMASVTAVLIIAFTIVMLFNYQSQKAETLDVLHKALASDGGKPHVALQLGGPEREKSSPMLPGFVVETDSSGAIISTVENNIEVTDEFTSKVTKEILKSGKTSGVLMDSQLRYLSEDTPRGTKIAFVDMTRELESMRNLLITLIGVGLGVLAAIFMISRFLAGWALRPAEKAWEQQRQFVADASHELKTPLTVILANTGILLSHRKDSIEEQVKWIENTQTEAQRMKKLVDDLLFLAKTDTSANRVKAEMDLPDTVWSSLLPFESVAYEQGITIKSEIEPDIRFIGDKGQLKQLVVILLDNACKYAGKDGIVTLKLAEKQGHIHLSVNNTGEPIPPEHLARLFERFYRSDTSRSREQGGYGLGLAIAESIAEKHNGHISVESTAADGTTFTVLMKKETK